MATTFTGFSTVGSTAKDNYKLYDLDLIRQDLLNHFNTRLGERVMRPEYGCRIWDYIMEQFTPVLKGLVVAEATRVCQSDPRVRVMSIEATSYDNGIRVEMTLDYVPLSTTDQFVVDFENRQAE